MVKSREWLNKSREEVISLHKQGYGYKKIAKTLNISRVTIGSIIGKFKAKGTVETVMLWGCFTSSDTGNLQRVQGIMNSINYQEILGVNVMQSVTKLKLGRSWTFQQDNDLEHTSKSTRAWLQMKGWKILEWPSQSRNLNPIENLCWDFKKAVAALTLSFLTFVRSFNTLSIFTGFARPDLHMVIHR